MEKNKLRDVPLFDDLKGLLYHSAEVYKDKAAFIIKKTQGKDKVYVNKSYKEFLYDINCFGTALYSLGLAGKRVAVTGRNSYMWAVAHFANLLGGMVSVPLDKELQVNELEDSLVRSEADALVYDSKYEDKIEKIREKGAATVKY